MSKAHSIIADGLRKLTARDYEVRSGHVTGVDETAGTIRVVTYDNGEELDGVLLRGTDEAGMDGAVTIPETGSDVIVASVDGPGEWVLLRASKLTKCIVTIGSTRLTMDADGYEMKRGSETLAEVLDDILTAIAQLTVTTGVGPSGVPINVTAFQQIKQRVKQLLK